MITIKNVNINIGEITIDTSKHKKGEEHNKEEMVEVMEQVIKHIKTLFDKLSTIDEKVENLTSDK
jgi:hypothetical protein